MLDKHCSPCPLVGVESVLAPGSLVLFISVLEHCSKRGFLASLPLVWHVFFCVLELSFLWESVLFPLFSHLSCFSLVS